MLRLKAFTAVLGEAPQNEYARFAVAFIYACALQLLDEPIIHHAV